MKQETFLVKKQAEAISNVVKFPKRGVWLFCVHIDNSGRKENKNRNTRTAKNCPNVGNRVVWLGQAEELQKSYARTVHEISAEKQNGLRLLSFQIESDANWQNAKTPSLIGLPISLAVRADMPMPGLVGSNGLHGWGEKTVRIWLRVLRRMKTKSELDVDVKDEDVLIGGDVLASIQLAGGGVQLPSGGCATGRNCLASVTYPKSSSIVVHCRKRSTPSTKYG
ncbi:hypothetical protein V6N11_084067 [Hibiscus sabdariffa]|uniref:Uncharacterized protein n=1 Tax=Hibiscus sabdariffa TaxID=183260 RepID=A0ABR2QDE5_9ROSI